MVAIPENYKGWIEVGMQFPVTMLGNKFMATVTAVKDGGMEVHISVPTFDLEYED